MFWLCNQTGPTVSEGISQVCPPSVMPESPSLFSPPRGSGQTQPQTSVGAPPPHPPSTLYTMMHTLYTTMHTLYTTMHTLYTMMQSLYTMCILNLTWLCCWLQIINSPLHHSLFPRTRWPREHVLHSPAHGHRDADVGEGWLLLHKGRGCVGVVQSEVGGRWLTLPVGDEEERDDVRWVGRYYLEVHVYPILCSARSTCSPHAHACTHIHVHTHTHTHTHTHMHVLHTHICTNTFTYTHTHTHTCTHAHTYTHKHVHKHAHTHTVREMKYGCNLCHD